MIGLRRSGALSAKLYLPVFRKPLPFLQRKFSSTGAGTTNRIPRDLQARINALDLSANDDDGSRTLHATKQRLQRPLEAVEKKVLTAAQLGQLQSTAEDLHDVLAEAMGTSAFSDLFPEGSHHTALAVDIHEVKLNRDCSHAYISWNCDVLGKFVLEAQAEFGNESAQRFAGRAVKSINKKLQEREAQFRSYIIRHMHFRRVPRLFFAPWDADLGAQFGEIKKRRKGHTPDLTDLTLVNEHEHY
jgi:ribosome-binding factor A